MNISGAFFIGFYMDNGFIKIHRKMIKWEWFADPKTFAVFMFLLLDANHTDQQWRGNTIKRGQTLTGRIKISDATGVSQQSVRTALSNLVATSEITIQSTNRFSIITICNYDKYQHVKDTINQPVNQQPTSNQPTGNQQPTTNKNEKNEKKEPKTKTVTLQLPEWLDPQAWAGFVEMRKKIKAPLTDRAMQLAISKLEKMESPNDVLDQSTINGWKGLFELKADFTKGNGSDRRTFQQMKTDATQQAMIDFVTEDNDDGFGENTIRQIDG